MQSLNIFNSRLVLASPETATDMDYERIEGVVGHECESLRDVKLCNSLVACPSCMLPWMQTLNGCVILQTSTTGRATVSHAATGAAPRALAALCFRLAHLRRSACSGWCRSQNLLGCCRFQLTLKEGLTVFRDQSFTGDMTSRVTKRIADGEIKCTIMSYPSVIHISCSHTSELQTEESVAQTAQDRCRWRVPTCSVGAAGVAVPRGCGAHGAPGSPQLLHQDGQLLHHHCVSRPAASFSLDTCVAISAAAHASLNLVAVTVQV